MRYLLPVVAIVGLAVFSGRGRGAEHTADSLEQVKQAVAADKAVLVDVREQAEWKAGHLEKAVLVPLSRLKRDEKNPALAGELAEKIGKDKVVYCHCRSGGRVIPAGEILRRLGYDVRPLKAGYADLLKAGFTKASEGDATPAD